MIIHVASALLTAVIAGNKVIQIEFTEMVLVEKSAEMSVSRITKFVLLGNFGLQMSHK